MIKKINIIESDNKNMKKNGLVNFKKMITKAKKEKYAIAHININNLEWIKACLSAAQETKSPIILGVSEGAVKYQNGYKNVYDMVVNSIKEMKITVPVVLHLDHGTYEGAKKALSVGFSSVMFDGSHLDFNENLKKTKAIVKLAEMKNASVECEVGTIGGEEDGIIGLGELANPEECKKMCELGIDALAAGIGNVHGLYPDNWSGLNFENLEKISRITKKCPIVLHGGSNIPDDQIKKAISLGVCKINVNTECQLAFAKATRQYILDNKDIDHKNKGYDPRKFLKPGTQAIKEMIISKMTLFGSLKKA